MAKQLRKTGVARHSTRTVSRKLREQLIGHYQARAWDRASALAVQLTRDYPGDAFAWKSLGSVLLESGDWVRSLEPLDQALQLDPQDPELHNTRAQALYRLGRAVEAVDHLETALKLKPRLKQARLLLIKLYNDAGGFNEALAHVATAEQHFPGDDEVLARKAHALAKLTRFGESIQTHEELVANFPDDPVHLSNLASAYRSVGRFEEAEAQYLRALSLAPQQDKTYSNYLMAMHYNPAHSAQALFDAHRQWQDRFAPEQAPVRPRPADRSPGRRLRVGMISAGFRIHPVGQMITSAVEQLPRDQFELYAYTMSDQVDVLTTRMQDRVDRWQSVTHLAEDRLAQLIRNDGIDILLDLCGHTEGCRLRAIAQEPAPLQVKWVGGLINTTGLRAMDYLISDAVETPPGADEFYIEKLIRMPDDYICYMPRGNAPDVAPPPAASNGVITFGCFNNPSKINEILLDQWAQILLQLPGSQLFLKGMQFDSEEFRERTLSVLAQLGIDRGRVILEGHSDHYQLLQAYNRVDIALDSWPYSGGLTTCEALLMGVPVITLPGPSFAGRHSASHLTHAGLPELVVDSWERYRELALDLASSLDNLSVIRAQLRQQLTRSPVCDYRRFGANLAAALRAIWRRYCEDKAPAALDFDHQGQLWFEGDSVPTASAAVAPATASVSDFQWQLDGRVVVLDNGAKLFRDRGFAALRQLNAFTVIGFDPASQVEQPEQYSDEDQLQLFPHAVLGDGQPTMLHACLDPELSSTLPPLADTALPAALRQGARVLTQLPISTLRLDSIEGLDGLDWLILDQRSDNSTILQHGAQSLQDTLLLQVGVAFQPTHRGQTTLAELNDKVAALGFRFYRFNDMRYHSHWPADAAPQPDVGTELASADVLYLPSPERMATLSDSQRLKLAFLLHAVFDIRDLSYSLLNDQDPELAASYLRQMQVADTKPGNPAAVASTFTEPAPETLELPDKPFMTDAEAGLFRRYLEQAQEYFEYGSGGSTVWAVEQGLVVRGVESDQQWVTALQARLGERCQVTAVDIGPTREWGFPTSLDHQDQFPAYSLAIEQHARAFDLILVDGRFRVASTLAAIRHLRTHHSHCEDARIFIHDFWNRTQYHAVLEFLDTVEQCESAGVFQLRKDLDPVRLDALWQQYAKVPI
ncbi:O-linked N-acetylglucosamine transferase, SPINDLY family protein [Kineobactrum salinum]|uniref:protein O-GlcNAc transferase n=1 Tax=Kineobactrum salinum TaxID=2708301 RepID=A0A6C0TX18_9GAMM|nr:tetratricopeptide repeat protein [Kineobactrum salinum]QIB64316.1 tetratricopeptide repeat protein [Kineobactrum salinum]